jgi:hypothetical protein
MESTTPPQADGVVDFWSEEKLKLPGQMGSTVWLVQVREDHNRVLHYINLYGSVVMPNKYLPGSHHITSL